MGRKDAAPFGGEGPPPRLGDASAWWACLKDDQAAIPEDPEVAGEVGVVLAAHARQVGPRPHPRGQGLDKPQAAPMGIVHGPKLALHEPQPFLAVGAVGVADPPGAVGGWPMDHVGDTVSGAVHGGVTTVQRTHRHRKREGADGKIGQEEVIVLAARLPHKDLARERLSLGFMLGEVVVERAAAVAAHTGGASEGREAFDVDAAQPKESRKFGGRGWALGEALAHLLDALGGEPRGAHPLALGALHDHMRRARRVRHGVASLASSARMMAHTTEKPPRSCTRSSISRAMA